MFDANGVPHLNDFGMATLLIDRETYETSTVADNLLWCPPEYRSHESTVPLKTTREGDVYSFGSITFTVSSLHYFSEVQRGHSKVDYIFFFNRRYYLGSYPIIITQRSQSYGKKS